MYMYMYVCIYAHMYKHTHSHAHREREREREREFMWLPLFLVAFNCKLIATFCPRNTMHVGKLCDHPSSVIVFTPLS